MDEIDWILIWMGLPLYYRRLLQGFHERFILFSFWSVYLQNGCIACDDDLWYGILERALHAHVNEMYLGGDASIV